ncbi:unnamed protein product [Chrysoparadoxa australica]
MMQKHKQPSKPGSSVPHGDIRVTKETTNSVSVSWGFGPALLQVEKSRKRERCRQSAWLTAYEGNASNFTLDGLEPCHQYNIRVKVNGGRFLHLKCCTLPLEPPAISVSYITCSPKEHNIKLTIGDGAGLPATSGKWLVAHRPVSSVGLHEPHSMVLEWTKASTMHSALTRQAEPLSWKEQCSRDGMPVITGVKRGARYEVRVCRENQLGQRGKWSKTLTLRVPQ